MEHAFAQTHSAESFPKGLASRRDSGDFVACARDDRVGRSEGFAICHPERSAQREVEGSRAAPAEEGSVPAVAFEHVSKRFGDAVAVDDVNLDIDEGAFVTIIGSSGCGKTTLLKMVNALAMPDDGRVLVHGKDTSGVDPIELRRNIGYAIQGSVLFPHLTVEQNIAYVPSLLNSGDEGRTEEAVAKWMDIIGLPHDIMDRYPAELSGGQAQRVGIARALAAMGWTVLGVTNDELNSLAATDAVAEAIRRHLGKRLRTNVSDWHARKLRLRRRLGLPVGYEEAI